jgi:hypothetical protein
VPAAENRVRLDLNSPEFQDVLFGLEADDLKQVVSALRRLRELNWNELYRHTGFRWEAIEHVKVARAGKVYSMRLSQRVRAVGFRDGNFLRLISLHLITIPLTNAGDFDRNLTSSTAGFD